MITKSSKIPEHLRIRFWCRWKCRVLWPFATAPERNGCLRIAFRGGTYSFQTLRVLGATVQSVYVRCLPIDDDDLAAMSRFRNCEAMDLGGTNITDEGVRCLTRMPKLQYLFLWHTRISDAAASILMGISHLRMLSLHDTLVSEDGLEKLNRALPNCLICPDEDRYLYGVHRDKDALRYWTDSG